MIHERRPATTIGELDIHLSILMDEMRRIGDKQEAMMGLLATKSELAEEVAALNKRIDNESTDAFFARVKATAVGLVAVATAIGVIVAIVRALPA